MTSPTPTSLNAEVRSFDDIVWSKATSKNGKAYEVGVLREDADLKDPLQENASGVLLKPAHGEREPFNVVVNWPLGDDTEKTTSTVVYDVAGISKYALYKNSWPKIWDYTLYFKNNVSYEYVFEDAAHNEWEVIGFLHRWHFVKFDSDDPTIVRIRSKGSRAKEIFG